MTPTIGTPSKLRCWWMPTLRGEPRKMLMQTSRNGYFFVLDRTNGKNLLTLPYGPVNWALGVDNQGRPIPNPEKEPAPDGRLIAPDEAGLTNYRSPSFDPRTGLFIVSAHPSYSIYFAKPADGTYGWAGADYGVWGKGVLDAIDYQTGKIRWSHESGRRCPRRRTDDGFRSHLHRRQHAEMSSPSIPAMARLSGMPARARAWRVRRSPTNWTIASMWSRAAAECSLSGLCRKPLTKTLRRVPLRAARLALMTPPLPLPHFAPPPGRQNKIVRQSGFRCG